MPNVEVTTVAASGVISGTADADAQPSLTILDGIVPTGTLPAGNLLFIAPPRATDYFSVTGRIEAPRPVAVNADEPIARYVDLRDVAIQDASRVELPAWGRAVLADQTTGAPLLIVGEEDGRQIGILAFDLRHSDLPLRVAFPLLMANLLDALVPGGAAGMPATAEPNRPLPLTVSPETTAVIVRAPDGTETVLTPNAGRVLFTETNQTGAYEVSTQRGTGEAELLGRFAVNVMNANESDVAPRTNLVLGGGGTATTVELPRSRNEWWMPLVWIALVVLVAEWLYAYRGQVVRLVRQISTINRSTIDG